MSTRIKEPLARGSFSFESDQRNLLLGVENSLLGRRTRGQKGEGVSRGYRHFVAPISHCIKMSYSITSNPSCAPIKSNICKKSQIKKTNPSGLALMKCPHCLIAFHDSWFENTIDRFGRVLRAPSGELWKYRTAHCPKCDGLTIEIGDSKEGWRMVYPIGAARGPVPKEVPPDVAQDYAEACNVLGDVPIIVEKGGAALLALSR
ncbi:MAG: hypothetical protein FJX06_13035 [Alphaproteobacteria bacterium]|nr:hypothetical protein [Alphaproteobacteria bacterium]